MNRNKRSLNIILSNSERFPKIDEFEQFCETDPRIVWCEWEDVGKYIIYCEPGVDIEELKKEMSKKFLGFTSGSVTGYGRWRNYDNFIFHFYWQDKINNPMKWNIDVHI